MTVGLSWTGVDADPGDGSGAAAMPVLEKGDPAGPAVVLVPGLTDGLYPVSCEPGRVLFTDVPVPMERCYGLIVSYRHPLHAPVTTRTLAEDLAVVLRRRLERPAVLIGHSMGTMVAQHLAVAHADLVAGMVLSAPLFEADRALRRFVGRWARLVRDGRWQDLDTETREVSYTGSHLRQRRGTWPVQAQDDEHRARYLALSDACLDHVPPERLSEVEAPTLLLAGELDPVAPPEHAQALAERLPSAQLHVLPGLAHGFPEQAPGPFGSLLTSFFGEVAATSGAWLGRSESSK